MKNRTLVKLLIGLFFFNLVLTQNCKTKDSLNVPEISVEESKHPIDEYIKTNYTDPYNISVIYKWTDGLTQLDKTLTPADIQNSLKTLEAIKAIWLDTYIAVFGKNVFRAYCPKEIMLLGSWSYNSGSITLATADAAQRITVYGVNERDLSTKGSANDYRSLFTLFSTINHEFAHIYHQNIPLDETFKTISAGDYESSSWTDLSRTGARRKGFITSYASSEINEDFAEMYSFMITYSESELNALLTTIKNLNAEAETKIRSKIEYVDSYLKSQWKVDYRDLRDKTQANIAAYVN